MKGFFAAVAALFCAGMLAGCAPKVDDTVVWQGSLPNTGVQATLSNCTLVSEEPVDYTPDKHDPNWVKMPALTADGAPVLTLQGVSADQVNLEFSQVVDFLYLPYTKVYPQIKLDYILTENPDGSIRYQFDTVTPFSITVTTAAGSDTFILVCQRDV